MANSHKAIHNMLHEVERVISLEQRSGLRGFDKYSKQDRDSPFITKLGNTAILSQDENTATQKATMI